MELDLYWQAERWLALEQARVRNDETEIRADGLIVGSLEGARRQLHYEVVCDPSWRTTAIASKTSTTASESISSTLGRKLT